MAEEILKQFISEEGGQEMVTQLKKLIDAKASPEALAALLTDYSKTTEVQSLISAAIEASEKKIFGEGELAEAFDTIKEIGDYLKDHDDVATAINEAIAKKLDIETAEETYQKKGDMSDYAKTSEVDSKLEDYIKEDELEETLEDYVKSDEIQAVPLATIKGWFE